VADDLDARLVVLSAEQPYSKESGSPAQAAAKALIETRGSTPRLYRNTLVFLAADKVRLQDLDEALRRYLAWGSIVADKETLNLDPHQLKQAETQKVAADGAVWARVPETYQWLLVPVQTSPQTSVEWQAFRLSGQEALAVRASKKLRSDELLLTSFAGTRLRMELDRVPLWPENYVAIKQLVEHFASYLYLPRLKDSSVLIGAVRDGVSLLTWEQDTFAFADSFDEAAGRYRGLRGGQNISVTDAAAPGLLVKPAVVRQQFDADKLATPTRPMPAGPIAGGDEPTRGGGPTGASSHTTTQPKRFHGTVVLDQTRVGRDASRIADEVIAHLAALIGATVTVTLEIEADIPSGAPDHVVRTVTENSRTLRFKSQAFEQE
jgi:hypothetical protein